jgi:hypothetical protein
MYEIDVGKASGAVGSPEYSRPVRISVSNRYKRNRDRKKSERHRKNRREDTYRRTTEAARRNESAEGKTKPTSRDVSGDWIKDRERREGETYRQNVMRATGAQRNPDRTVDPEVSYHYDRIRNLPERSLREK